MVRVSGTNAISGAGSWSSASSAASIEERPGGPSIRYRR